MTTLHVLPLILCATGYLQGAAAPQPLATFPEKPVLVQLKDDTLLALFLQTADGAQEVAAQQSKDIGATWTERQTLLRLDKDTGIWNLPLAFAGRDGGVHLFFLNDGRTPAVIADEATRPRTGHLWDRHLDIWHTKSAGDLNQWTPPAKIWDGYTGALNSAIQMKSGRILLRFSLVTRRRWAKRGERLDAFTYRGQFDSTLVYSDDEGATWQLSPADLKVPVPDIVSAYGAVEPVVLELADGRVWMLVRTQQGRFYESFSADGALWSTPRPGAIVSSDSPGGIVRTPDGCIVLLWNNCLRFPYAYGGRQVIHAAVSSDEGLTWRGYREVARDSLRNEPPPPSGDHGTAYPFPIALSDGRVAFATGQGEAARIACMVLEPDWLLETRQSEDFSKGLDTWSVFGTRGVGLLPHPQNASAHVLGIQKTDKDWPACAVWNFPAGGRGALRLKMQMPAMAQGILIGLTDHYSVPFDDEDVFNNVFNLRIGQKGEIGETRSGWDSQAWHSLDLIWDCAAGTCAVTVDGANAATLRSLRAATSLSYLRVKSLAGASMPLVYAEGRAVNPEETDPSPLLIESVAVEIQWD